MGMRRLRISVVAALALAVVGSGLLAAPAQAQTPFVPYFGKNQIRFFNFDWKVYQTEHFEIFITRRSSRTSNASPATPRTRTCTSAVS
jgi:hypothetical protein